MGAGGRPRPIAKAAHLGPLSAFAGRGVAKPATPPALMRDARAGGFVDEAAGLEAVEVEGAADRVMRAGREEMGEQRPAGGNRLEAAGSPAAIEEDARDRRGSDDRRGIRDDIDDAAPLPHQLQLAEGREHLGQAGDDDLLHRRSAALAIGRDAVEPAAEHEFALVRLARIGAGPEMQKHDVEAGL